MCYISIHMDHWWHLVNVKVMILLGNPSISRDFLSLFSQNVHTPLPWQRACIWMKEVLIAWFLGHHDQDRKVSAKSVLMRAMTLCKNLSGYRELLLKHKNCLARMEASCLCNAS